MHMVHYLPVHDSYLPTVHICPASRVNIYISRIRTIHLPRFHIHRYVYIYMYMVYICLSSTVAPYRFQAKVYN